MLIVVDAQIVKKMSGTQLLPAVDPREVRLI